MSASFGGKVAVVTGAASGIGRGLATELAARGARLALSDVNEAGLAETAGSCATEVRTYRLDVAQRQQVFDHAAAVLGDFGQVDYLFNNAGVALKATFEHATLEEIDWQLSINLQGVIYCTKAFCLPCWRGAAAASSIFQASADCSGCQASQAIALRNSACGV